MLLSDRLQTFAAFAEDANLSRTARRLHLSQPAVHAQLKALAVDLGVPLYRRVGRGLVLTAEGIELAAFARELGERENELRSRFRGDEADAPPRPVVLAAGSGALVHLLAGGIRAFTRARRRRIEVITADAPRALELVEAGIAHVGVGVLPRDTRGDLVLHPLATARQLVVVPRSDPLAKRRAISVADLRDRPLIVPPEPGPQRAILDAVFAARGIGVQIAATARGWDVVLRLVELGIGVGIVNSTCVLPRTLVGRPVRELPPVSYQAFTRPHPRADARALVAALVDDARARGSRVRSAVNVPEHFA